MKRRYVLGIAIIAMSVVTAKTDTAFAEQLSLVGGTGEGVLTMEQLLHSYECYSGACAQIRSDIYLAALEEQSARESAAAAEAGKEELQAVMIRLSAQEEQLKAAKAEYEIAYREILQKEMEEELSAEELERKVTLEQTMNGLDMQIAAVEEQYLQIEIQRAEQELTSIGAQLGWKQKAFYTENRDALLDIRTEQLNYTFFSEALRLPLLQKQQEYYACCEELLEVKKRVNEVRARYGIAAETEEKDLLVEAKRVESYLIEGKESIDRIVEEVRREAYLGNASLVVPYCMEQKTYHTEAVINSFLRNSESYLQLSYYGEMYLEYEQSLPLGKEQEKEQAKALAENYGIKKELSRKQVESYAKEALAAYDETQRKLEIAEETSAVCEKKYFTERKKLEYGRATKQSVLECKAELLKAEAEYLQCLTEKLCLEYVLEHGVLVQ